MRLITDLLAPHISCCILFIKQALQIPCPLKDTDDYVMILTVAGDEGSMKKELTS